MTFRAQHISHSFPSNRVLIDVSLELEESCLAGLIGPSGSGKSILMKILGRVYEPDTGTIEHPFCSPSEISLMFQEGALFDSLSVFDNIAFPLVHGNVPVATLSEELRESVRGKVESILGHVGLKKAAFKMPAQLSGGMRRRISLARALVAKPKVALLDDPTCGLDPVASSVIMDLIVDLHREYRPTMILVSHDLRRLLPVVGHVFALFHGRIQFSGTVEELTERADEEVRTFVSCRYDLNGERSVESSPA